MAKLPNLEMAIIDSEKLCDYILSPNHPVGQFKAAFFQNLGYSAENWQDFEQSLRNLVFSKDALEAGESAYGKKYIIEGPFESLSGEIVQIVTVWIILKNERIPRFVTAYPGGSR